MTQKVESDTFTSVRKKFRTGQFPSFTNNALSSGRCTRRNGRALEREMNL